MSLFPTQAPSRANEPRLEADGVLVQPISGQIYLIEEDDFDEITQPGAHSWPNGLINRH